MVGFLGLSRASAAAWTLLAPEWFTTLGGSAMASGCECSDEAVEVVAEGDATDLGVAPGEALLAGAAILVGEIGIRRGVWRASRSKYGAEGGVGLRRRCLVG